MYQELEMYKEYKKEKQLKHKHEVIASVNAIVFFTILTIVVFFTLWEVEEYLLM